jgi:TonB family protein
MRYFSLNSALVASLLFHLALFEALTVMPPRAPHSSSTEYIPVELVQLPPAPRQVSTVPAAKAPSPPKPAPPVIVKEKAAPPPPPVAQKIAAVSAPNAAPATGPTLPARTATAPVAAAPGKGQTGSTGGSASPARQGADSSTSGKRDKGDYLAFHRLSRLPAFRVRSEPVYPKPERMTGSEARVLAEIYLDERGTVDEVTIKKSGGRLFDKAVIDAVRLSSFHPGYMGDKAVPTVIQIPYTFKLK